MKNNQAIKIFDDRQIRTIWDKDKEKWFFSVVDVCGILTDQPTKERARNYWKVLKNRLKKEGNQSVTNCNQLRLKSTDGKNYLTDVADVEQLFRIIQSIPSPKAEPFKIWMSQVASQRIDQLQDPEKSIDQALQDYKRLGYSDKWINQRLKSIEIRKALTDEWQSKGVDGKEYATLTDIITQTWSGFTTKEYKNFKGLKKENLRDNMTNKELVLNMLAELSTTEISQQRKPQTLQEHKKVAQLGGNVSKVAKEQLEKEIGKKVVTPLKASDYLENVKKLPNQ